MSVVAAQDDTNVLAEWDAAACHATMALVGAAENGDLRQAEFALQCGADIDFLEGEPLYAACERGHFEVATFLLEKGANVHVRDGKGNEDEFTFLFVAAAGGHARIVSMLISCGADVAADNGKSLSAALYGNKVDAAKMLIGAGVDLTLFDASFMEAVVPHGNDVTSLILDARTSRTCVASPPAAGPCPPAAGTRPPAAGTRAPAAGTRARTRAARTKSRT